MTDTKITVTSLSDDGLKYVFTAEETELYKDRSYSDYRVLVTVETDPLIAAKVLDLGEDRIVTSDLEADFDSVGLSIIGKLEFRFKLDLNKAPKTN